MIIDRVDRQRNNNNTNNQEEEEEEERQPRVVAEGSRWLGSNGEKRNEQRKDMLIKMGRGTCCMCDGLKKKWKIRDRRIKESLKYQRWEVVIDIIHI